MQTDISKLCKNLSYQFKDCSLLRAALTHRSVCATNNERLEFLGDSIVNFIIAEIIYDKFPKATEGELSRLRANLVKGETLAEIAREVSIGQYLVLGPGELRSGGETRQSILADTLEAIIAAIYFDAGMKACQLAVLQLFAQRLQQASIQDELKDDKTQLQEYLQARRFPLPTYQVISAKGDAHKQIFEIECTVLGFDYSSRGSGTSRRRAEQVAAKRYLKEMKLF